MCHLAKRNTLFASISTRQSYETQLVVTVWWESREGAEEACVAAGQPEPSPRLCILHEIDTVEKCNERQCWEARDFAVLSVECSPLHNHTCPASLRFPMDLAGFGVDLGRKMELSLPSLACSPNQTPERCSFEYPNGNLTFFQRYLL